MKVTGWISGIHLNQYETDLPNGTLCGFDADLGEMVAYNGKLISKIEYDKKRLFTRHIAGSLVDGVQNCILCGKVLADYRNAVFQGEQPKGWPENEFVYVHQNFSTTELPNGFKKCCDKIKPVS